MMLCSTASTAILVGDRLVVANVGDSMAVICRGKKAIAISGDHKPGQTDERRRIEEAGGFVMWVGTKNVEAVDGSLELLILASDGLWDVVTNEDAVAMVQSIEEPEKAAKKRMREAYQRGYGQTLVTLQESYWQMSLTPQLLTVTEKLFCCCYG
ncbi:hypothetical protein ZIOFF_003503 [Zingiber officinale]|uniref:protein-serine/threonine phosphatase n=1 Tax=Zingiber officinale TaxID=94328 RepID=A0A8J5IN33_ZINOF|nr:hypothetical protein ZIOFF_003503 [Zingiber officinale]